MIGAVLAACGSSAQDRIVGRWIADSGLIFEFQSDGLVTVEVGISSNGRWMRLDGGRYSVTIDPPFELEGLIDGVDDQNRAVLEVDGQRINLTRLVYDGTPTTVANVVGRWRLWQGASVLELHADGRVTNTEEIEWAGGGQPPESHVTSGRWRLLADGKLSLEFGGAEFAASIEGNQLIMVGDVVETDEGELVRQQVNYHRQ
ncbi:MAG: hypothetical protein ABL883_10675 [Terricaulis sp.]